MEQKYIFAATVAFLMFMSVIILGSLYITSDHRTVTTPPAVVVTSPPVIPPTLPNLPPPAPINITPIPKVEPVQPLPKPIVKPIVKTTPKKVVTPHHTTIPNKPSVVVHRTTIFDLWNRLFNKG